MNIKSLMSEQQKIIQKFFAGTELDYYEALIAYGVLSIMREHLLNRFAELSNESEDDD